MTRLLPLVLLAALALPAQAQHDHSHDHAASGEAEDRTPETVPTSLTESEIAGLLAGAGMGLAKPAELHSYPGPLHVLELAEPLGLTDEQRAVAETARLAMLERARLLGKRIVQLEQLLDEIFASGGATEDRIARMTDHIADARAELRATHLIAHLAMRDTLSEEQIATYNQLRGYTP